MKSQAELNDQWFEQQVVDGTLSPASFNHQAHLRLAWLYLNRYGLEQAQSRLCLLLATYAESAGVGDKFNKTLTVAATKAVFHFLQETTSITFEEFIDEFPRLNHAFKTLLRSHYSDDIFLTERAKTEFVEPDLLPF